MELNKILAADGHTLPQIMAKSVRTPAPNEQELVALAYEARKTSYSPYSHFAVGAALLAKSGKIYLGCNIENAAFTPTSCAERTAFFKAVSDGEHEFEAIAIAAGPTDGRSYDEYCAPCGVCRQVMMEFCDPDTFNIIVSKSIDVYRAYTLSALMPCGFGPADLKSDI